MGRRFFRFFSTSKRVDNPGTGLGLDALDLLALIPPIFDTFGRDLLKISH
jgi:hypothetical protein